MWKLLRNLLLAGVLIAGALKLLAWYEAGQEAQRLSAMLAPAAQVSYDGLSAGLDGSVALTNVVLTAKTEKGPDAFRAERVVFETPNVLWVIKHGLLNETTLPAHLGIAVQGLKLPPSARIDSHWLDTATLVPFANAGCAAAQFSGADYRKMDVNVGDSRQRADFRYDADTRTLDATLTFIASDTASIALSTELRPFDTKALGSAEGLKNLHIGQLGLDYTDSGFLKKRNQFCAQRANIAPTRFVDQHIAAVQQFLQQQRVEASADVLKVYRRLVENGGRASILSLPNSGFTAASWLTATPDELLRQLNVTTRYGDTPQVMFRLSFLAPPEQDDVATALPAAPGTPSTTTAPTVTAAPPAVAAAAPAAPASSLAPSAPAPVNPAPTASAPANPAAAPKPVAAAVSPTPLPPTVATVAPKPAVPATPPPSAPASPPSKPAPTANGLEEVDRAEAKLAPLPKPVPQTAAQGLQSSEPAPPPGSTLALVWKPTIERLPAAAPERRDYDVIEFAGLGARSGRFVRLITVGGKKVEGYIVSANDSEVELRTSEGGGNNARFVVPKGRIQEIQLIHSEPPA